MTKRILIIALGIAAVGIALAGCVSGTGNLHVQVVGNNNAGLPGAKVVSNEQPGGQLKVTGMTGADGSVTYNDIKAGDYEFYVSVANYEQKNFTVNVAGGKTTNVTITMKATSPPPSMT